MSPPRPNAALVRPLSAWWPLPLRLIAGFGFMEHGYAKLARGPGAFAAILAALGMPAPGLLAWITILVELAGGLAVLAGVSIPLASVPMIFVLLVAIVTVHLPNGFSSIKLQSVTAAGAHFGQPGYETDLLYMACLIALVLAGPGPLAFSFKRRRRPPAQAGTLRVARPSDDPDALLPFYVDGLGLELLFRFEDHDGFDGLMVGREGSPYHLEFTRARGHVAGRAPTADNLLVFYHPREQDWPAAIERMTGAGFVPVKAFNPFWDRSGRTFEDPDGYRVVLQRGAWRR